MPALLPAGALALLLAPAPVAAPGAALAVAVRNPLDLARSGETVELPAAAVARLARAQDLPRVHVADEAGRDLLAQAVDEDGDGLPDLLAFQADFTPRGQRSFVLTLGEKRALRPGDFRAYGRFVRERHDDFAWENDRVAHRVYGTALETWAAEPLTSSAVDIWLKRTRRLVLNDWYMVDDYHRDTGEGADLYSAGRTRGCGGSGLWRDGRLVVSKNFRGSRVLANGPLRVEFELDYPAWDAPEVRSETKRVTLDAGRNLSRFQSRYDLAGGGEIIFAVGIKQQPGASLRVERGRGWLRTWEPAKDGAGHYGCGIVLDPAAIVDVTEADGNYLVVARAPKDGPATYYAGFGWDRSGDFAGVEDWDRALDEWSQRLRAPLLVEVKGQ